jgi:hypothetical protein
MSQQTMRGMRLGAQSLESEVGVVYTPRANHLYQCPKGHQTSVVFALEAELPESWQCKTCSEQGMLITEGQVMDVNFEERTGRSHWEMLLERRTHAELEEILQERLDYIRERRAAGKSATL